MNPEGKSILITGSARRVGRVIALELAKKGAHILLHYNQSADDAKKTQSEILALGARCTPFRANLSHSPEISNLVAELDRQKIKVDVLVNSASLFYKTPLENVRESDWDDFFAANLKGPFLLSKELGLRMKKNSGGKIINIADWSGFRTYRDYAPYCASKGGLITLTKALARDLAPSVTVNAIAPGPVMTPSDMNEEEKDKIVEKTLLGRWGQPEDVAHAVEFLIDSDYINGQVIVVDGGRSIV